MSVTMWLWSLQKVIRRWCFLLPDPEGIGKKAIRSVFQQDDNIFMLCIPLWFSRIVTIFEAHNINRGRIFWQRRNLGNRLRKILLSKDETRHHEVHHKGLNLPHYKKSRWWYIFVPPFQLLKLFGMTSAQISWWDYPKLKKTKIQPSWWSIVYSAFCCKQVELIFLFCTPLTMNFV